MDSPNLERAIRFKSNAVRGGVMENIFVRDVTVGQVRKAVRYIEFDYKHGANGPEKPVLRNVVIENVTCQSSERVTVATAFPGTVIEGIRFENCAFRGIRSEDSLKSAEAPVYHNVSMERGTSDKKK